MSDLEQYAVGYLRQWNERATVRSRPRRRLTAEEAALPLLAPIMMPALDHPALAHLDAAKRHEYSVRQACDLQEGVAVVEVDSTMDLAGKLGIHGMGIALPEAVRQVALTIATDEAYHAYAAREFISDAERLTGVVIPRGEEPPMKALAHVRQEAPAELLRPAETIVLCFVENFVAGELFGLSKDGASDGPFQAIVREHMIDEGRHQVFFQKLLRYLWAEIDEEAKVALGNLLPGVLDALVLNPSFFDKQARILDQMGFDHETSLRILYESYVRAFGPPPAEKYQSMLARTSLNLLATSGIMDHAPTREALVASGWAAAG